MQAQVHFSQKSIFVSKLGRSIRFMQSLKYFMVFSFPLTYCYCPLQIGCKSVIKVLLLFGAVFFPCHFCWGFFVGTIIIPQILQLQQIHTLYQEMLHASLLCKVKIICSQQNTKSQLKNKYLDIKVEQLDHSYLVNEGLHTQKGKKNMSTAKTRLQKWIFYVIYLCFLPRYKSDLILEFLY